MNKMIAGSSSKVQQGHIKNNLDHERKPNSTVNRTSQPRKNLTRPKEEEEEGGLPSPDTRAEIPSILLRFAGGPGINNGHHLHNGFDGNMSIWNVNEDISFLNGNNNNPLEL
jgi:hypothetical protein